MAYNEQSTPEFVPPQGVRGRRQPTGNPKDPYGLGDPEDQSLRKVELDVMIPIKMRDRAKAEKCTDVVKAFSECCKTAGVFMVVTCKTENSQLKACLTEWYNNADFKKECTAEYLKERSDYRRTGIKNKEMKKYLA